MTDLTITRTTETAITITLNSLADDTLVTSSAITPNALDIDHHVQVTIANIAETGTKAVGIFAVGSIDTSTYDTSEADGNMHFIGSVEMDGSTGSVIKTFALAAAFGGFLPESYKIVARNSTGVSLASSGNLAEYSAMRVSSA